jgi:hypothetical protein
MLDAKKTAGNWRMAQPDSNPSRREKFPVTGKNTGNFINRERSIV